MNVPKSPATQRREAVCDLIKATVCSDRNVTHGDAEDNFATIAEMWQSYLSARGFEQRQGKGALKSTDVAAMMAIFKAARIATNPAHIDSWIDMAGYAACGAGVVKGQDIMERAMQDKHPLRIPRDPNAQSAP